MEFQLIISLVSLVVLEVILGIDNVIFMSILSNRLPQHQQKKARQIGLVLAAVTRLGLLLLISIIIKLENELFSVLNHGFSGKDLILIAGGLFLMYKSTKEIYHKMEGENGDKTKHILITSFYQVLVQILIMDMVFSIDSIITAVGIADEVWVMYVAVIVTLIIMLLAAEAVSDFVNRHPTFKMLALSFLLLIGFSLVSEGWGLEIPKGYIYFAMAFSFIVDILQMRMARTVEVPVAIHEPYPEGEDQLPKNKL